MSDMQLYLLALGAIFIAAVILFNWWQERRLSQDAIRRFDGPEDDPLMESVDINRDADVDFDETTIAIEDTYETVEPEPVTPALEDIPDDTLLSDLPGVEQTDLSEQAGITDEEEIDNPFEEIGSLEMQEELLPWQAEETVSEIPEAPDVTARESEIPPGLDAQIDLIAQIRFDAPLSGAQLREALQPLPGFDKATQWLGRDESGVWATLTRDQEESRFERLAAALQFADRSGALSRECLRKFQLKIETLADQLEAEVEWINGNDPLRYAAELDQFCIDIDVMVGFHLLHGGQGPFAATKLRGIAEAGGMQLREDGAFHYETESGDTLFTLVNRDQRPFTPELLRTAFISGISFQLDVPRVRNCPEAFNQMVFLARKMETSLNGVLIDDNQQPLTAVSMDKIREQLRIIYAKMVARSIIPGSPSALRLFS